ncbi:hypothetical protein GCM10009798_06470 [Nocardioides panacihumi]|uniref:Uncharacterized protein n=1 Tax=Nocardioides panacihumi TaxID=400774 RepID=A0ABN2QD83_9ACTN
MSKAAAKHRNNPATWSVVNPTNAKRISATIATYSTAIASRSAREPVRGTFGSARGTAHSINALAATATPYQGPDTTSSISRATTTQDDHSTCRRVRSDQRDLIMTTASIPPNRDQIRADRGVRL